MNAPKQKRTAFQRLALVFSLIGYASLCISVGMGVNYMHLGPRGWWEVFSWLAGAAAAALAIAATRFGAVLLFEVLVLGLFPVWGTVLDHLLSICIVDSCDLSFGFRPFALPELYALMGLHLVAAFGYVLSRRRPEALPTRPEAVVVGLLLVGLIVDGLCLLQLVPLAPYLFYFPLTLPLLGPLLGTFLFWRALRARLGRRGREAREMSAPPAALSQGLGVSGAVLGLYALAHALVYGNVSAFARVFTRTCNATMSLEVVQLLHEKSCHYLCTVAARGHRWLVQPQRYGVRGGARIIVNRQLCVANAFEDLLHERMPRIARWLRAGYDRFGLPVSRFIARPLASDAVYVAMKPFEWAFYIALLLFDPGSPEARIDRMYR